MPPPADDKAQKSQGDVASCIDKLMAQPIKGPPQITVFGDEAVFGINPAPARGEEH